jgi:selenocysteine lyase/cysteine desulfurase
MGSSDAVVPVGFGKEMRSKYFQFDKSYTPLNHGSYGAFPITVRDYQRRLQDAIEARSDPFIRYQIPKLLIESRTIIASYLDVSVDEVVFVPNATTAVNTVLRNLKFLSGDVILYFSFAYPACIKTIQSVCETSPARSHCIDITFPIEDCEFINVLESVVNNLAEKDNRACLLMFDTVVTFPGLCLPWKLLLEFCRSRDILSLVDGAHGIGHVDLKSLIQGRPDFFTSNCYK